MESQPQNPEFRINPENFHPCNVSYYIWVKSALNLDAHLCRGVRCLAISLDVYLLPLLCVCDQWSFCLSLSSSVMEYSNVLHLLRWGSKTKWQSTACMSWNICIAWFIWEYSKVPSFTCLDGCSGILRGLLSNQVRPWCIIVFKRQPNWWVT